MTDLLKVTISEGIEARCGAIVNAKVGDFQTKFDRFVDHFGSFFNGEDIQDRLDRKVEVQEFKNLKSQIALKSDVLKSRKMVGILNHRLQQISILNAEIAKSLQPNNNSLDFRAQRDYIAKQCEITKQWILDTPLMDQKEQSFDRVDLSPNDPENQLKTKYALTKQPTLRSTSPISGHIKQKHSPTKSA